MNPVLTRNTYIVKEHLGIFKAANSYDIYDPVTGSVLMECREHKLGLLTKIFRFTDYKTMTPFEITVVDSSGKQVVRVKRGFSIFLSKVEVFDENDALIGMFKQKLFSIGGAFAVLDSNNQPLCELKGKWTGWDFRFTSGNTEFAHVTKKWSGLGKEMFTSADNYALEISETLSPESDIRSLILAAVMCIDMVLKE